MLRVGSICGRYLVNILRHSECVIFTNDSKKTHFSENPFSFAHYLNKQFKYLPSVTVKRFHLTNLKIRIHSQDYHSF